MSAIQTDITKRFIKLFEEGRKLELYKTAAEFCGIIECSPQSLNEVVKGRSNVGVQLIQNTLSKFPDFNAHWLITGKGKMIFSIDEVKMLSGIGIDLVKEKEFLQSQLEIAKKLNTNYESIIELQNFKIEIMKGQLEKHVKEP